MVAARGYKCLNGRCRQMQTRHAEIAFNVFVCADGRIARFERFITKPTRRTQSFSGPELDFWSAILETILRGGDTTVLTRHPEMKRFVSKVTNMARKSKDGRLQLPKKKSARRRRQG